MPIKDKFHAGKKVIFDKQTGREIWQMTTGEYTNHAPYMYNQAFDKNDKYIIYSSNRTGSFQIHRLEIESGEVVQLTDMDNIHHMHILVNQAGNEVLFGAGTQAYAIHIETGEQRFITDFAPLSKNGRVGAPRLSGDDSKIMVAILNKDSQLIFAEAKYNGSKPQQVASFQQNSISHLNYCPTDNNIVTYVPPDNQNNTDLPREQRARAHKINLQTGEREAFLVAPPGYRATHEYWSPDGSKLFFHQKDIHNWVPASIGWIPKEGGEVTLVFTTETIKLGHSSINSSQTKIVSDNQEPRKNELILIDVNKGTHQVLCWPNASGAPHPNHVHPAFNRLEDKIIYTSDNTGYAQVYVLPLNK